MRRGYKATIILFSVLAVAAVAALIWGAVRLNDRLASGEPFDQVQIVTSLYTLQDFATRIGGDMASSTLLLPPGQDPHSFEPRAGDIAMLNTADIFVYNGAELEPWVDNLLEGLDSEDLLVVDASASVDLIRLEDHEHEGGHDGHGFEDDHQDDGHGHGAVDPHTWLDPLNAIEQAGAIRDALMTVDPANRLAYADNAEALIQSIERVDAAFERGLASCERDEVIVTHEVLGYFCQRYGCRQVGISGLAPEAEPSPAGVASIVSRFAGDADVIFTEELLDPKTAEVIAEEIGASTRVLKTVANVSIQDQRAGKGYADLMLENLEPMREALDCS